MKLFVEEKEFMLMPEIQDDIEEFKKENEKSMKIKVSEESTKKAIKIIIPKESIEIKSPKKDENAANCYDKNKFKKIIAVVISNKFNHKNKIKKFKYIDIRDLVDNINKNTIGETDAKIKLNALNKLKNAEIKNKRLSCNQAELLKSFDDLLEIISNNNNNNSNNDNNNSNNNSNNNESDNENDNDNENEGESESDNVNESESNNENDNNNNNNNNNENEIEIENENYDDYEIKKINDYFKMID